MKFTRKLATAVAASALLSATAATAEVRPPDNASDYAAYFQDGENQICAVFYAGPEGFFLGFNEEYHFMETSGGTSTSKCRAALFTPPPSEVIKVKGTCAYQYRDGAIVEGNGMLTIKPDNIGHFVCNTNRNRTDPLEFIE